jgi:lipoate-protein ligase A
VASTLDLIVQHGLTPSASAAEDGARLAAARGAEGPALRVYDCAGSLVSLGRYHLAPEARAAVGLARRHPGGRAVPFGEGFVGVALTLPHRAALVVDDPLALAPEQVMNRYVRGLLEGLRLAGVPAFYPGRDAITVEGRVLARVSFEVDASGALLFEAGLAVGEDFGVLAARLDAADPGGVVPSELLGPDAVTSLARALGRTPATDEVAALVRRGYEAKLPVRFRERDLAPREDPAFAEARWVGGRRAAAGLDRRGTRRGQIGVVESRFGVAAGRLTEVVLAGDFIANSPAVAELEAALRGCPAEPEAVRKTVADVFARPGNFVLGVGPVSALADAVVAGLDA